MLLAICHIERALKVVVAARNENIAVIPKSGSYFYENLRDPVTNTACLDISAYTYFEVQLTAQQGTSFTVQLQTCAGTRYSTALTVSFTNTFPETKVARIPLSAWGGQGATLTAVKQFSFVSWVNPSGKEIVFDNVQLTGGPTTSCSSIPTTTTSTIPATTTAATSTVTTTVTTTPTCPTTFTFLSSNTFYAGSTASTDGTALTRGTSGRFTTLTPTGTGGYFYIALPTCLNASTYTHLQLDISGPAGGSVQVGLDWFSTSACTGKRGGVAMTKVNTTGGVQTVRIPLAGLISTTNLGRVKSFLIDSFTGAGTYSIDYVVFVRC
ncbi:hypothetical protein HDV00_010186 [Rhizophlyctis rosea]|nr:hypothetical protein HDV00_010186 [Rhizophlyctis rosea]